MIFQIEVDPCCGKWLVESTEQVTDGIARTVIICGGCAQRRVLTVTNRVAHTQLEVVP